MVTTDEELEHEAWNQRTSDWIAPAVFILSDEPYRSVNLGFVIDRFDHFA